jgi:uncharacterized PurR-regulated membrane protein YhhQ (DUF165 family)
MVSMRYLVKACGFTLGSIAAFMVSQLVDVFVFHKIKATGES